MTKEWRIPFTQVRVGRFLFLLISILLLLILNPFFHGFPGIRILLGIYISLVLLAGIYAVSQKRYLFTIALFISLPAFVARWSTLFVQSPSVVLVGNGFMTLFCAYLIIILLSYLFREDEVTTDLIMAALCVYFFLGLMWAYVFSVLEGLQPGSFRLGQVQTADVSNFVYYSFVTQTTLGYGDITPATPPARSLSYMEAAIGQLYVAVLVARLVGVHIAQSSEKKTQ
jgi:hypothetical protein